MENLNIEFHTNRLIQKVMDKFPDKTLDEKAVILCISRSSLCRRIVKMAGRRVREKSLTEYPKFNT